MFSVKAVIESVVEHGRRAVLQATRSKINPSGRNNHLKLSEAQPQGGSCRLKPKGINSVQNNSTELQGTVSTIPGSSGGGIVSLLRPVTSRLVQSLVRKVSSPLWTEARRKSAKRLFGETAPYFALVGVTLVSGPERGLLTAHDELEAICGDIREAISRAGWIHNPDFWKRANTTTNDGEGFSLKDFDIGSVISKGCNAVVYAARWKKEEKCEENYKDTENLTLNQPLHLAESLETLITTGSLWSLDGNLERSGVRGATSQNNDTSSESSTTLNEFFDARTDACSLSSISLDHGVGPLGTHIDRSLGAQGPMSMTNFMMPRNSVMTLSSDVERLLSKGGFPASQNETTRQRKKVKFMVNENEADMREDLPRRESFQQEKDMETAAESSSPDTHPLAVKMMFNYEAESNAPAILTAMYKEMLPARHTQLDDTSTLWKERLINSEVTIPQHINIVDMPCVFVDRIPLLSDGLCLYPDALPKRLNPGGYGRNMSLFCVMKRYDCTLAEYLRVKKPSLRTSLLLLTQLFEAVYHLHRYGVAHRDLKSDNLLLCLQEGFECPHLVVSDFGCCLPDPSFRVMFSSYEADPRVGNAALMAPEIKSAKPGLLTWINYSKADIWAAGTIAYEIFGLENPFVQNCPGHGSHSNGMSRKSVTMLDSATYKESQLPRLPKTIPGEVRSLIHDLLKRNPKQRPSPTVAASICQLSLWGPRKWLNRHALTMPSNNEVMQWLLCLSSKVLCEAGSSKQSQLGLGNVRKGPGDSPPPGSYVSEKASGQLEYEIVSTFLKRVHYSDIVQAVKWVRAF